MYHRSGEKPLDPTTRNVDCPCAFQSKPHTRGTLKAQTHLAKGPGTTRFLFNGVVWGSVVGKEVTGSLYNPLARDITIYALPFLQTRLNYTGFLKWFPQRNLTTWQCRLQETLRRSRAFSLSRCLQAPYTTPCAGLGALDACAKNDPAQRASAPVPLTRYKKIRYFWGRGSGS